MSDVKTIKGVCGRAIPKPADDQNTDDITPARYLKEITFKNMRGYVYFDERFKNGSKVEGHPFNNEKYGGANILVAGANYGCGSSREHAPQALYRFGIRAIIAESFAEIFAGNCTALGLVTITVSKESIQKLSETVKEIPNTEFTINLNKKKITFGEHEIDFDISEGKRQAFLNGTWDSLSLLKQNEAKTEEAADSLSYLKFN